MGLEERPSKVAVVGTGEFLDGWINAVRKDGGEAAVRAPGNIFVTAQAAIESGSPRGRSVLDQLHREQASADATYV